MKFLSPLKCLIALLLLSATAWSAIPPLSDEERTADAAFIFEGEVVSVTSKTKKARNGTDHHYLVKVRCSKWTKGNRAVENPILVRLRTTGERPEGWTGGQGQNEVPSLGDQGRFYTDTHFRLLEPNGWHQLSKV